MYDPNAKIWSQQADAFWLRNQGISHKRLPNAVYTMEVDSLGNMFLREVQKSFVFDYKVYGLEKSLIDRAVITSKNLEGNLGILLNGQRGTGKTVTAKLMCNSLNLPIIVVDRAIEDGHRFLNSIPQDIVIFIDEYEKIFEESHHLLSIMDGAMNSEHKRIFILTTNELYVNDNLIQRPGRIRYLKTFKDLSREAISEIINDCLVNQEYKEDVFKFVSTLQMITVDVVKTICQEVNLHDETPEKFAEFFNVKKVTGKFDIYLVDERGERTTTLPFIANAKFSPTEEFEEGNYVYINGDHIGQTSEVLDEYVIKVKIETWMSNINRTQKKLLGLLTESDNCEDEKIGTNGRVRRRRKLNDAPSPTKETQEDKYIEAEVVIEVAMSEAYHRMYRYMV